MTQLTIEKYASSGAENSHRTAGRIAASAFEGRKGHGGKPYVVHRQMGFQELETLLMAAYSAGWRDGVNTFASGIRLDLVSDI